MSDQLERYHRQIRLKEIGISGQHKLRESKVLVIGAGGLGCPALQYLAAAGIGNLGIIDHDQVELSNLHRQILFNHEDEGKNKALIAKHRLLELNPEIEIRAFPERLNTKNALDLLREYDIIMDGTDNFSTRYLVNDACVIENKPWVYGAIFKFQGQVSVFNYKEGPTYRCLFPIPPSEGSVPNCEMIGVLGVVPGIIGSMMANEALKMILGIGEVLSAKLWTLDTLSNRVSTLSISKNQTEIEKIIKQASGFVHKNYAEFCGELKEIEEHGIDDVSQLDNVRFIDLRETDELPPVNIDGLLRIPFSKFPERLDELSKDRPMALFCQSGVRSKKAVEILRGKGFSNVYCLRENAEILSRKFSKKKPIDHL